MVKMIRKRINYIYTYYICCIETRGMIYAKESKMKYLDVQNHTRSRILESWYKEDSELIKH